MVRSEKLNTDTQNLSKVNLKHKDSLFRIAFREKKDLLEPYNAINGSNYTDPEELVVYTLEDVVFMGIKNDVSFLIGEMLNLYEHQSTKNPNMPIRGLLYFASNYSAYIAKNNLDIYGTTLQKLPLPQFYVLYNGREEEEDRCKIELEDAFPKVEGAEVKDMVLGTWGTENHLRKVKEEQEENERNKIRIRELEQRKRAADLLGQRLLDMGKTEELRRALADEDYQTELLREYRLIV